MNAMKKVWKSPVTSVQAFAPQEYIAACESQLLGIRVYGDMILGTLYHDNNGDGNYDQGETLTTATTNLPADASSNPNSYYPIQSLPNPITNDNRYYTGRFWLFVYIYTGRVTGTIYKVGNHYFTSYDTVMSAS